MIIGDNVWIGDNSVILGPASIGNGAIIGANSLVRGEVPSNSIVAGTPARVVKRFNPQKTSWGQSVTRPRKLFSVCIPAYNRPHYLGSLLDSILAQEFHDFEIVICEGQPTKSDSGRRTPVPVALSGNAALL